MRVMAGECGGVAGPIKMRNPGLLFDVRLGPSATWSQVGRGGGVGGWVDGRVGPAQLCMLGVIEVFTRVQAVCR